MRGEQVVNDEQIQWLQFLIDNWIENLEEEIRQGIAVEEDEDHNREEIALAESVRELLPTLKEKSK